MALYDHAVLHLSVTARDKKWRPVFAFVELLPREVPAPLHDGVIQGPQLKQSNRRIFADHVPLSCSRALAWYEDVRRGRLVRPDPDGTVPLASEAKSTICEPLGWAEEPAWPDFVCADTSHSLPFLSRWHSTPRVHHLIPTVAAWDFSPEDAAIVDTFLEEQFGFRRSSWPQLAGSVHLVAPNPYFRDVSERLSGGAGSESISISVEPRSHIALPQLKAHLVEHRPTGIGGIAMPIIDATPKPVLSSPAFHETSLRIDLVNGGALHVRERAAFSRRIQLTMDVAQTRRQIHVYDGPGSVVETYEVEVMQPSITSVGHAVASSATTTLTEMMNEIDIRHSAKQLEQQWFSRDPIGARDFVRSRIQMAREQLLVADPWLGGVEVQRYGLAVPLADVPIRLLTTADGFNDVLTAAWLAASIAKWKADEPSLGDLSVRVMTLDELHDRFLRVDNRLYTLGNSLNSLGDRASLIMRVPDPAPVFLELERLWQDAEPLADFAARRK